MFAKIGGVSVGQNSDHISFHVLGTERDISMSGISQQKLYLPYTLPRAQNCSTLSLPPCVRFIISYFHYSWQRLGPVLSCPHTIRTPGSWSLWDINKFYTFKKCRLSNTAFCLETWGNLIVSLTLCITILRMYKNCVKPECLVLTLKTDVMLGGEERQCH